MAPLTSLSATALARLRAYGSPSSIYSRLPLRRRAAVLLLLFADSHGDLRVVLTLRSATLKSRKLTGALIGLTGLIKVDAGEVCLPGGRADTIEEEPFQTARREAYEEIGLQVTNEDIPEPFEVKHLCEMPANLSKNGIGVRPCIAFLSTGPKETSMNAEDSLMPQLNAKEVAAVFSAPLKCFVRVNGPVEGGDTDERLRYEGSWLTVGGKPWRAHRFHVPKKDVAKDDDKDFVVWGMTARILVDAARIAYNMKPDFEHNDMMGEEAMLEEYAPLEDLGSSYKDARKDTKLV